MSRPPWGLCCVGCLLSSIPSLSPPDASGTSSAVTQMFLDTVKCSGGVKSSLAETHCYKGTQSTPLSSKSSTSADERSPQAAQLWVGLFCVTPLSPVCDLAGKREPSLIQPPKPPRSARMQAHTLLCDFSKPLKGMHLAEPFRRRDTKDGVPLGKEFTAHQNCDLWKHPISKNIYTETLSPEVTPYSCLNGNALCKTAMTD